jgi:hypothetical protein
MAGSCAPWLRPRAVIPIAGLIASVPLIVTVAQAVGAGWTPSSDDGIIALRSFDVLSAHPPLVGQYSQTSPLIGQPTYSLGPMLYWLLAVPAHSGGTAMVLTIGLVNVACVMGVVALAGRRGGAGFAVVTAIAMVLLYRSIPAEVPYEVWNCWAGLYPFTALLFLAWSVGCGDYRLLPVLAVVGSYVLEIHFTYLVPGGLALTAAVVGLAIWRHRAPPGTRMRPWVVVAVVAALVCWSAPLADQAIHRPGNLALAYRVARNDRATLGASAGWHVTARALGLVPDWAKRARTARERIVDSFAVPRATAVTAVLVLLLLPVALLGARRRRDRELATALALAVLLCVSMLIVASSVPSGSLGTAALVYALTWMAPAAMFVWLALAWAAWGLLGTDRALVSRLELRSPVALAGSLLALVLCAAAVTDRWEETAVSFPPGRKDYNLIRTTNDRIADAVAGSRSVRMVSLTPVRNHETTVFQRATAYALRREGIRLALPHRLVREAGARYSQSAVGATDILNISDGGTPIPPGSKLVVRIPELTVTLSRRSDVNDGTAAPRGRCSTVVCVQPRSPEAPARSGATRTVGGRP